MRSERTTPYLKLLFAVFAWGGSFIATKTAVVQISPNTLIWMRFAIGLVIIGLIVKQRNEFKIIPKKDLVQFAILGFIGITFHQYLQSTGLLTSDASTTAWIVALTPIFIAILGWLVLKEKLKWFAIFGIIFAAIGVILVVTKGNISQISSAASYTEGDFLILLSAINWAVFSILARRLLKKYESSLALFYIMGFGWFFTSISFIYNKGFLELTNLDQNGWTSVLFLGIGATGLAYIAWFDGLKVVPAAVAGSFIYLEPLFAAFLASIFLDERITKSSILGGLLILFGVWIVTYRKKDIIKTPIN
ncbi:MAG: DMT family transporter [Chloroflexi bacterium]|nr:DMT family transporter [Chloroflexota bacterium]MBT3669426.1 DMT family transporter [Chloroflexota bacterium]MBT4003989.1 DMT family transporter [Chloroflexota bacterium]MBT4304555.1 DMT family transporter [Chloroflexota bacterium]MBT4534104.1 DMT family transporter [Chloroflexota bacterium]